MQRDKNDEMPEGFMTPLELIETIFWGMPQVPEIEVETMTTAEVMAHLKTNRAQLTKWSDAGELKPVSRGKYDAAAVRSFVPPSKRRGKANDL